MTQLLYVQSFMNVQDLLWIRFSFCRPGRPVSHVSAVGKVIEVGGASGAWSQLVGNGSCTGPAGRVVFARATREHQSLQDSPHSRPPFFRTITPTVLLPVPLPALKPSLPPKHLLLASGAPPDEPCQPKIPLHTCTLWCERRLRGNFKTLYGRIAARRFPSWLSMARAVAARVLGVNLGRVHGINREQLAR